MVMKTVAVHVKHGVVITVTMQLQILVMPLG